MDRINDTGEIVPGLPGQLGNRSGDPGTIIIIFPWIGCWSEKRLGIRIRFPKLRHVCETSYWVVMRIHLLSSKIHVSIERLSLGGCPWAPQPRAGPGPSRNCKTAARRFYDILSYRLAKLNDDVKWILFTASRGWSRVRRYLSAHARGVTRSIKRFPILMLPTPSRSLSAHNRFPRTLLV